MRICYLIALLFILPYWLRSAPDTIYLDASSQTLERGALYLGKPNQSITDLPLTDFQQVAFQAIPADTTADYYIHFIVKNNTDWDNEWILVYKDYWDNIDLYIKEKTQWELTSQTGQAVPVSNKLHFGRLLHYLPLSLKSQTSKEIVVHLAYDLKNHTIHPYGNLENSNFQLAASLKANDGIIRQRINIFFGIFLIMFIYNLLIFIFTKDKNYLFYLFIIIGAAIGQEVNFMFLEYYFESTSSYQKTVPWLILLFHGALALFTRNFLSVPENFPFWNKVISGLLLLFIITPLPAMFGYMETSYLLIGVSRLSLIVTILIIGIKSYRLKIPSSGYFLIGQLLFLLSMLISPLFLLRILPFIEWSFYLPNFGSTSLIVLFSVALADRINALRKENEEKQSQIIQSERKNTLLEKERVEELREINASITRFVPYEFISALHKQKITDVQLGDHVERTVSVLFSDIRSYTTIAESMTPEENFKFVVNYSKRMGPIIDQNNGFISQYLGDGIMSLFLHRSDDAVQAAIDMQLAIQDYNGNIDVKNRVKTEVGIGLETGSLIMGIIGHSNRTDPATISDTVNTSARLEGLTKFFKVSIIIGEIAFNSLENSTNFNYRYLGKVLLKGKKVAIDIYDFIDGDLPAIKTLKLKTKATFDQAMNYYMQKEIATALALFKKVLAIYPSDHTAAYYALKCQKLVSEGIADDWTPIEQMWEK